MKVSVGVGGVGGMKVGEDEGGGGRERQESEAATLTLSHSDLDVQMDRGGHHGLGDDQHVFQANDHDQVGKDLTAQHQHQHQQSDVTAVHSSAPKPCNALPQSVREAKIQTHNFFLKECYLCMQDKTQNAGQSEADSLTAFCRHLKTHQFSE